jgi:hypothetical protein
VKPINQRTKTDCLRCCIAMVLGLDYADVPSLPSDPDKRDRAVADFATLCGYDVVHVQATGDGDILGLPGSTGAWIASGPTIRGTGHAVVYVGDMIWHDPHSSRVGLIDVHAALVFVRRAG